MKVSSANSLFVDEIPLAKSFMSVKNNKGPNTEPCGTPAKTSAHDEHLPFSNTRWCLF